MKFRSPTEHELHISLTSGHTAVVTPEGNEILPIFNREAIARGAIPMGVGDEVVTPSDGKRTESIQAALQAMLDGGDEGDFNEGGQPNLSRLKARLGFSISRAEADAAWQVVSAGD